MHILFILSKCIANLRHKLHIQRNLTSIAKKYGTDKLEHGYIAASDPRKDGQAVGF